MANKVEEEENRWPTAEWIMRDDWRREDYCPETVRYLHFSPEKGTVFMSRQNGIIPKAGEITFRVTFGAKVTKLEKVMPPA